MVTRHLQALYLLSRHNEDEQLGPGKTFSCGGGFTFVVANRTYISVSLARAVSHDFPHLQDSLVAVASPSEIRVPF